VVDLGEGVKRVVGAGWVIGKRINNSARKNAIKHGRIRNPRATKADAFCAMQETPH